MRSPLIAAASSTRSAPSVPVSGTVIRGNPAQSSISPSGVIGCSIARTCSS